MPTLPFDFGSAAAHFDGVVTVVRLVSERVEEPIRLVLATDVLDDHDVAMRGVEAWRGVDVRLREVLVVGQPQQDHRKRARRGRREDVRAQDGAVSHGGRDVVRLRVGAALGSRCCPRWDRHSEGERREQQDRNRVLPAGPPARNRGHLSLLWTPEKASAGEDSPRSGRRPDARSRRGVSAFFAKRKRPGTSRSRAFAFRRRAPGLDWLHILCLEPFGPLGHVEADLLAFRERAKTFRVDGRVVAKDILAAIVLRDEPKALRIVEPLHCTGCHALPSQSQAVNPPGPRAFWRGTGRVSGWSTKYKQAMKDALKWPVQAR